MVVGLTSLRMLLVKDDPCESLTLVNVRPYLYLTLTPTYTQLSLQHYII